MQFSDLLRLLQFDAFLTVAAIAAGRVCGVIGRAAHDYINSL